MYGGELALSLGARHVSLKCVGPLGLVLLAERLLLGGEFASPRVPLGPLLLFLVGVNPIGRQAVVLDGVHEERGR